MPESIRVLAGDCTVIEDDGDERRERRGRVVTVVKPDDTVLVHDANGYQPVAWLTRADAVTLAPVVPPGDRDPVDGSATDRGGNGRSTTGRDANADPTTDGTSGGDPAADGGVPASADAESVASGRVFAVAARKGEKRLRVGVHEEGGFTRHPATAAGSPVGDCPACGAPLVRSGRSVSCLDCGDRYGLPEGATVREDPCACGLPTLRVERGTAFELCLDRNCEGSRTLEEAVGDAFDRAWDCPECGGDLRVLRRGGIMAGCERYPDCETGFVIPAGTVAGDCDCGLPAFVTGRGRRCLDSTCEFAGG